MVGRALAESWNFPAELTEGIGSHHDPEGAREEHRLFVKAIFISDYLMFQQGYGYVAMPLPEREILQQYVRDLGLQWYALRLIGELVREELERIEQKGYLSA
jgi:hypothetical protein